MLKIMIVCNNGCSSSAIVRRLNKEVERRRLCNQILFSCQEFLLLKSMPQTCDLIMLCPQTYLEVLNLKNEELPNTPIYLIPPKIFVEMPLDVLLEDAEDILQLINEQHQGIYHFPMEENYMKNRRSCSYRQWLQQS